VGELPFNGDNDEELAKMIIFGQTPFTNERWTGVSKEARLLVKAMLTKKSEERFSLATVRDNPWVAINTKGARRIKSRSFNNLNIAIGKLER